MKAPMNKKHFYKSKADWEAFTEEMLESGECTITQGDIKALFQLVDTLYELADYLYKKQDH